MSGLVCMIGQYFNLKPEVRLDGMNIDFNAYAVEWQRVAAYIRDVCKAKPTITSAHDGVHSVGSMHQYGKAVDVRIRDWTGDIEQHCRVIAWLLGSPWCVVLESNHAHIQTGALNIISNLEPVGSGRFVKKCV